MSYRPLGKDNVSARTLHFSLAKVSNYEQIKENECITDATATFSELYHLRPSVQAKQRKQWKQSVTSECSLLNVLII